MPSNRPDQIAALRLLRKLPMQSFWDIDNPAFSTSFADHELWSFVSLSRPLSRLAELTLTQLQSDIESLVDDHWLQGREACSQSRIAASAELSASSSSSPSSEEHLHKSTNCTTNDSPSQKGSQDAEDGPDIKQRKLRRKAQNRVAFVPLSCAVTGRWSNVWDQSTSVPCKKGKARAGALRRACGCKKQMSSRAERERPPLLGPEVSPGQGYRIRVCSTPMPHRQP